ncbi:nuclear transport factor 2 family protein [Lacibacter sediminis]|uniref:Nuclear transport factor 2 family protein n=1 Tax=Lacibacter sediminis TaxID=2760713 RepID=A0A7G5XFK5_9BACT|nr:nuclear transport factor 2 family protein [Lacibacter sediminis]QNA44258.1 nuclear transport factor 2 family protein [Lacibacter sediminis]
MMAFNFRKYSLLLIFSIAITLVAAQSKKETKVSEAVEKLKLAMVSGERAALESIAADQLSYGHSGGLVETKAQFVEKIASGQSDFVTIELKNQTIAISGNTAIVRHELHATTNDNNKPGEVHLKIMLVWQKQSKEWKLLARQAVKITP